MIVLNFVLRSFENRLFAIFIAGMIIISTLKIIPTHFVKGRRK